MNNISAEIPDWSREQSECFCSPSKKLLYAILDYQRYTANTGFLNKLLKKLAVLRHRLWGVITGADIPLNYQVAGGGVLIPHPNGIVIHSAVIIGPNCLIHQQVTICVKSSNE